MTVHGVYAMQAASALSIISALAILITILHLKLFHKLFLKLVFYVALSDLFAGISTVVGGTDTGSPACYLQGLVSNYFTLSSIFWTATIGYEVHLVVWKNRVENNLTKFSIFNWLWPLTLSLIPLSTSIYGNDDSVPGWCFLDIDSGYPHWLKSFWFIVSFYMWIYASVIYLLYVVISVYYKLLILQRGKTTDANVVVERIIYYPVIVVICWGMTSVIDLGLRFGLQLPIDANGPFTIIFSYLLPNLQGFFSAIVFFSVNGDIAKELKSVVKPGTGTGNNNNRQSAQVNGDGNGPRSMSTASGTSTASALPGLSLAPMNRTDVYDPNRDIEQQSQQQQGRGSMAISSTGSNVRTISSASSSTAASSSTIGVARGSMTASIMKDSYRMSQQIQHPINSTSSDGNGNNSRQISTTQETPKKGLYIDGDAEDEINGPLPNTEGPLVSEDDYYTHHIPIGEPSMSMQYGLFMNNPLHDAIRDSDGNMSVRDSGYGNSYSYGYNHNNNNNGGGSRVPSVRLDGNSEYSNYDGEERESTATAPIPIPTPVAISRFNQQQVAGSADSIASSLSAMELEKHSQSYGPQGSLLFGFRKSVAGEGRTFSMAGGGGGEGRERTMSNFFSNIFRSSTTTPSTSLLRDSEIMTAYNTGNSFLSADAY